VNPSPEILIVDDNPADIDLVREALAHSSCPSHVSSARDGVEAITLLSAPKNEKAFHAPDLIMLDLSLPRKDGRAVLAEVKSHPALRRTPVVVFSTSCAQHDILGCYELGANSYVSKPGDLEGFLAAVISIERFWFDCARLPRKEEEP